MFVFRAQTAAQATCSDLVLALLSPPAPGAAAGAACSAQHNAPPPSVPGTYSVEYWYDYLIAKQDGRPILSAHLNVETAGSERKRPEI